MITIPCPLLSDSPAVISALDVELVYINSLPSRDRADGVDHGVAGQLLTLFPYLMKAADAWTQTGGDEAALDVIRKLTGTCLRALILYGCPERQIPPDNQELLLAMQEQIFTGEQREEAAARLKEYRERKALDDVVARMNAAGMTIDRESLEQIVGQPGVSPPVIRDDRVYPGGGNTPIVPDGKAPNA